MISTMTPKEQQDIYDALNFLTARTTDLMRHTIWAKAWDDVFLDLLIERMAAESGKTTEEVRKMLNDRHKEKHQQRLEVIENINPARAAELDKRGPDDILP